MISSWWNAWQLVARRLLKSKERTKTNKEPPSLPCTLNFHKLQENKAYSKADGSKPGIYMCLLPFQFLLGSRLAQMVRIIRSICFAAWHDAEIFLFAEVVVLTSGFSGILFQEVIRPGTSPTIDQGDANPLKRHFTLTTPFVDTGL